MKTIKLSKGKEKISLGAQNDVDLDYSTVDYIKAVINNRPQDGFGVEDIRKRFRVLDAVEKIEEGSEELQLEDQDFEVLKQCVNQFKWGVMANSILEFADQFK
jgi:hypothetical protein